MRVEIKDVNGKDATGKKFTVYTRLQIPETIEEATSDFSHSIEIFEDANGKKRIFKDFDKKQKNITEKAAVSMVCSKPVTNGQDIVRAFIETQRDKVVAEKMQKIASMTDEDKEKMLASGIDPEYLETLIEVAKNFKA